MNPVLRPGGQLIAYLSGGLISNEMRLFLRRFPEGEGRWQVTRNLVTQNLRWSRNGDRLFFVEIDESTETLMEVLVSTDGDRLELGDATPLFSMSDHRYTGFDVTATGERFIMLQKHEKSDKSKAEEGIVIVQNWFEEFRQ